MSEAVNISRGTRKRRRGKVVRAKQGKTVIVETTGRKPHPLFKKIVKTKKKYTVHDEKGEAREGDVVLIEETRPLSKTKRWRVVSVLLRFDAGGAEKFEESSQ